LSLEEIEADGLTAYYTFFLVGVALYAAAPWFAQIGSKALFVLAFGVIPSMYGGGLAIAHRVVDGRNRLFSRRSSSAPFSHHPR